VNWWKSSETEGLLCFSGDRVQWIFLRGFGKASQFCRVASLGQTPPQSVRVFPTSSSHLLHTRSRTVFVFSLRRENTQRVSEGGYGNGRKSDVGLPNQG